MVLYSTIEYNETKRNESNRTCRVVSCRVASRRVAHNMQRAYKRNEFTFSVLISIIVVNTNSAIAAVVVIAIQSRRITYIIDFALCT